MRGGRASVVAHDAGRRSRDAGFGLSQARRRPRRQHVPAGIGRGRRAARPLFDDRPRSRPDLALERRGRRDQPPRARRADAFVPCPGKPLDALRALLAESRIELPPGLPPMSAGVFGYLGYDMVRHMERLPPAKPDPIGVPEAMLIRPTVMVVFDSVRDEMVVVTPVRPAAGRRRARRTGAAQARLDAVVAALEAPLDHVPPAVDPALLAAPAVSNTSEAEFLRDGRQGEGVHRRRRRVPDRAVAALHQPLRTAGVFALSRAAARQSLALSLLPRFRRLPDRRLEPGDPGARARAARSASARSPARAGAARPKARTRRWRANCSPTRRSAPSI